MIDPTRLRALLSDHPPQAFHQKDQPKVRDVWEFAVALQQAARALAREYRFVVENERSDDPALLPDRYPEYAALMALVGPDTNTSPATKEPE